MAYIVGKVIKLHQKDSPGTRKSTGLVRLDGSKEVLEFTGIIGLSNADVNKTKIFGTILGDTDGTRRMTKVKRF
ncbi:MAG: hypothetical protein Q7R76_06850 [Candidatus Woesearchaeota archaeon]|nr:hypothetical protein [Candidatus Woesearchaeota archaeon]